MMFVSWLREHCNDITPPKISSLKKVKCKSIATVMPSLKRRRIPSRYDLSDLICLGCGNFGSVYRAYDGILGIEVAIKVLNKKLVDKNAVCNEVFALSAVKHSNIVRLVDVYDDQNAWYIVMEVAKGEELFNYIVSRGIPTEIQTAVIMYQLCSAMSTLHSKGIVHGDLKPENCFLDTTQGKIQLTLVDFGSSTNSTTIQRTRNNYTMAYCPPEVLSNKCKISPSTDVWAFGVILYTLMTGVHPFDPDGDATEEQIMHNILYTEPNFTVEWSERNRAARNLAMSALSKDRNTRPTADSMLTHPFILTGAQMSKP